MWDIPTHRLVPPGGRAALKIEMECPRCVFRDTQIALAYTPNEKLYTLLAQMGQNCLLIRVRHRATPKQAMKVQLNIP
jgi:hypothetical protein